MEKTAQKKTYRDPAMNKIVQEKAAWNKQVSALINDLIHFKKSMNGWPSKYYKERTRITQPVPVDLSSILNQIAGDFQEIASRGNGILEEQAGFSKAHLKKKTDQTLNRLEQTHGPVDVPKAPPAPGTAPDLTQQLGKGASKAEVALTKLASNFEDKYFLESQASNPFSRFVTRLFNPKFGFGEAARIRRLRMTMLDNCVKALRTIKMLQAEIVKSSKQSIINSHKLMTSVWNYWNIVNRLLSAYKALRPGEVKETGGKIVDPDRPKDVEEEHGEQTGQEDSPTISSSSITDLAGRLQDFKQSSIFLGSMVQNSQFQNLASLVERTTAMPKSKQLTTEEISLLEKAYQEALEATARELGFSNMTSFHQIAQTVVTVANRTKEAQEFRGFLGKTRHQIIPGATSGSRLEIYNLITQIRKDLDNVMDLLESGFDQKKLSESVTKVNREMATLRTVMRSLYYSEKPEEAPSAFF